MDDDPLASSVVRDLLTEQGHDVSVLHSSEGVLERLKVAPPDMILLDVMLPGLDGLSLCRQIRAVPGLGGIRIILLTGRHFADDKRRADVVGADLIMRKPFQGQALVEAVRGLLER